MGPGCTFTALFRFFAFTGNPLMPMTTGRGNSWKAKHRS